VRRTVKLQTVVWNSHGQNAEHGYYRQIKFNDDYRNFEGGEFEGPSESVEG